MNHLKKPDETRAIFLHISKGLDNVWYKGLIIKLKCNGISDDLLSLFEDYLLNRNQRVILNGLKSTWRETYAGVPQRSVLVPLLFLVYINDLPNDILSEMPLFADDSSIFTVVNAIDDTQGKIEKDISCINIWMYQWEMIFNPDITKQAEEVIFSVKNIKPIHPTLTLIMYQLQERNILNSLGGGGGGGGGGGST